MDGLLFFLWFWLSGGLRTANILNPRLKRQRNFFTSIINALGEKNIDDRISKLQKINAPGDNAKVVIEMLLSDEDRKSVV